MTYEIIILSTAEKELKKLPHNIFTKIDAAIIRLSEDPRPQGCKKL